MLGGIFETLFGKKFVSQTQSLFNTLTIELLKDSKHSKTSNSKIMYPELQMSGTPSVSLFSLMNCAEP